MKDTESSIIKVLAQLGRETAPTVISPEIADLQAQLDKYEQEMGQLDPDQLSKYLIKGNS